MIDTPPNNATASTLSIGSKSPRNQHPRYLSSVGSSTHETSVAGSTRSTEYAYVTVTPESTATDVVASVAKKRNVYDQRNEYSLVMCDSDGKQIIERVLDSDDLPYEHQQAARIHGHLGDFHFVFRKVTDEEDDSDQEFFTQAKSTTIRGDQPAVSKLQV